MRQTAARRRRAPSAPPPPSAPAPRPRVGHNGGPPLKVELPGGGWEPRGYQLPLWQYLEGGGKRANAIWHRRAGKDDVALHWAAISAHERIGNYWHLLPEYEQGRKAIWNAVNPKTGKRRIDEAFPKELRASTNASDMFIRFKNGSTWQVIGSDNYHKLVGTVPFGVVFSEWSRANPAAWAYLAPILAENGGWSVFITTPIGRNHAKTLYDIAKADPNWFAEVLTVNDTKALAHSIVEAQRKEYHGIFGEDAGDALIEQEYYCSFEAAILGSYYGKVLAKAERAGRICDIDYDPRMPVHTVWDLGKGKNMAIWCFQVAPEGIRVIDFLQGSHDQVIPDLIEELEKKPYRYGIDFVPHDAKVLELGTRKTRIETMIGLGRNPELVPDHRVQDGINAATLLLGRCRIDRTNCAPGIEALRQYRAEWDDKKKVFKITPRHDWASHPSDGFRYLAMAARELGAAPPAEEPVTPRGAENMTVNELLATMGTQKGRRV